MPRVDFSQIEDARNFTPLPEGEYRCRITDVEECTTQHGDAMWKLTLEVVDGLYGGRRVFDNLVFSDRALKRVKHFCAELGLPVAGVVDLSPTMIRGRECIVTVQVEETVDEVGNTKTRNRVPFTGYRSAASGLRGGTADSPLDRALF